MVLARALLDERADHNNKECLIHLTVLTLSCYVASNQRADEGRELSPAAAKCISMATDVATVILKIRGPKHSLRMRGSVAGADKQLVDW